jgi:ArsR family transcriptional regulator
MVSKETLAVLKALADDTRLKILELLLDGEKCVCEIFPKVKRTQSTVSIQLGKLEKAGLIESRREGKKIFYKIKDLVVCDIFKALGYSKGTVLKKACCMNKKNRCHK